MTERDTSYARAITTMASGEQALDAVADELLRVARAVSTNREFYDALTDPALPPDRRLRAVDEVLAAAHPATRAALAMLVSGGRVAQLEQIAAQVAQLAADERGRALAEVRVAVPIDGERTDALRAALEAVTGKKLEMKVFVDPTVVGGVHARIGDLVIDGSLARRLADVKQKLGG